MVLNSTNEGLNPWELIVECQCQNINIHMLGAQILVFVHHSFLLFVGFRDVHMHFVFFTWVSRGAFSRRCTVVEVNSLYGWLCWEDGRLDVVGDHVEAIEIVHKDVDFNA